MRWVAFCIAVSLAGLVTDPLAASPALPHLEEIAPGVHATGFADRHQHANCGWVALGDSTLLIDLPRGVAAGEYVAGVAQNTGKPVRALALTGYLPGDGDIVAALIKEGVRQVVTSANIRQRLLSESKQLTAEQVASVDRVVSIGDATVSVDIVPLDSVANEGAAAVHVARQSVLFAGPLVINGPRLKLSGKDTARWIAVLRQLEQFEARHVIPGFGSWRGDGLLHRQRRLLVEARQQVGHGITMGRSLDAIRTEFQLPAAFYTWTPGGSLRPDDVAHVYGELTVPAAPFQGRPPDGSSSRPQALVLIGDRYHEPAHLEEGLRPVFDAAGVDPHFTVDVRALSAENLSRVQLFVILRDGMLWPGGPQQPYQIWMTPEQEQSVVEFVERGGGFLNLHNSMGLYPKGGPYLNLVGGRYIGHGPLERFRVLVADRQHPITRGVEDFTVADEQHTPPYDEGKVRLLLQNRSDEGKVAAAGWAYEPGKGRVCHLANGHTLESLVHPMYQRLMRNAVNWCLRREVTE